MESSIPAQAGHWAANELRAMAVPWAVAGALPLPILMANDPAGSGDISCLYLGLASGWLVVEFHRSCGLPESFAPWRARTLAVVSALAVNVAFFIAFGVAAAVQTQFPFPLMAGLSVIPAVGIVPWWLRRVRGHPYASLILAAMLVLAAKLAACVVARIVYGPDYMERGYVSADWRSAKLMISLFWSFSVAMSLGLLLVEYRRCKRNDRTGSVSEAGPIRSSTAAGGAV
jgi:hypothetical protein